jgi:hypothetical protein
VPLFTLGTLDEMLLSTVENNSVLYTRQERVDCLNEAVRILNLHTGFLHTSARMPRWSVAGRSIYRTPPGILVLLRMEFEGRYLHPLGIEELNRSYPQWMKETTATTGSPVARWAKWGLNKVAVHPADAIGGQDMYFYGIAEPALMVNDSDTIPMNDELADEIKDYAAHILPMKEGGAIFSAASLYYQEFIRKRKATARWKRMKWPAYFVETEVAK